MYRDKEGRSMYIYNCDLVKDLARMANAEEKGRKTKNKREREGE